MTFGQRLKDLRNEKSLTQLQLADMLNLSKANISKYEAGSVEPNIDTLKLIADIFNVSTDYLLGTESKEKATPKGQPLTKEQQNIALAASGLSTEEAEKVIDYVEFVKTKRKS